MGKSSAELFSNVAFLGTNTDCFIEKPRVHFRESKGMTALLNLESENCLNQITLFHRCKYTNTYYNVLK